MERIPAGQPADRRFNRALLAEWAHSQVFTSNLERAAPAAPLLEHCDNRRQSSLKGRPPVSRLSTNVVSDYT